ncbi:hypothetical protein ACFS07_17155 [Undibacterium arcticum]
MEEEYEVPSPHEHEFEEAVEKKRDGLTQKNRIDDRCSCHYRCVN